MRDELRDRLGRGDAERVDDDDLLRARLDGRRVDLVVEIALGPGRVDAEERRVDAVLVGEAHRAAVIRSSIFSRETPIASSLRSEIGDSITEYATPELDERLEIGGHGAREAPDLCAQAGGGDPLDRLPVVVGDAREAGFDPVDAELVEQRARSRASGPGRARRRRSARRRAASCRRGRRGRRSHTRRSTRRSRSAQTETTPSGNGESCSAPVSVIRKLSSTRRPPPPSQ